MDNEVKYINKEQALELLKKIKIVFNLDNHIGSNRTPEEYLAELKDDYLFDYQGVKYYLVKIGRPTIYIPEFCNKVDEYLETRKDEEYDWTKSESSGKVDSESWEHRIKVKIPTLDGFARFIGVNRDTLFDWREKYKDFSDSLEKILIEQKERLISYGLSGDYNPTIAKLILASNHDMRDKLDTDVTSKGKSIGGFNFIRNDGDNNTDNKTNP